MTAVAPSTAVIRLLAPAAALPAEGEDALPDFCADLSTDGVPRVLGWYQHLAAPGAVRLRLNGLTLEWPQHDPDPDLTLVELEESEEGLAINDLPAGAELSWAAVAEAYARGTDESHFLGGTEEAQRILFDAIRSAARETVECFEGEPLPLIEKRILSEDVIEFVFLGIWLADEESTSRLISNALPPRSMG
jgi:hypothetical protein